MPAANKDIVGVDLALELLDEGCVAHDQAPQGAEVCTEQTIEQDHRCVNPRRIILYRSAAWM